MKKPQTGKHWYYVDETGDPTFYDKRGKLIVGQPGCSPILALGFLETTDPQAIRLSLDDLRQTIITDPYLRDIPSIAKTKRSFHAKDDCPEVRYLVFKRLAELDFKCQFIIARKQESIFRNFFGADETKFYAFLVKQLFRNVLHRHEDNFITFADRGSCTRQALLEGAIKAGRREFESRWGTQVTTQFRVLSQSPAGEPALQVIDYMSWAVYRAFTKREMRYYRFIKDKVSLLVDYYDRDKRPNNWYSRTNPFDIQKASPL